MTPIQNAAESNEQGDLNQYYESLAFDLDDGDKGHFLSGWQCDNPFASAFLDRVAERASAIDHRKYVYFDDDEELVALIRAFHARVDRREPEAVLCGAGTTPLLFALVTYLHARGITRVHFVPPLYFTLHRAFALYGIEAVPVSWTHPFEEAFELALPNENASALFLTDPVWYAGKALTAEAVQAIAAWQERTGSLVIVDGSLQYLQWAGSAAELTAHLDPSRTFRLVCPSKQLCVHGYRFSYVLLPNALERSVGWTYSNIAGPVGADSVSFAREAVAAIEAEDLARKLVNLAADRHRALRDARVIGARVTPDAGYFVFEKINIELPPNYKVVDGRYFNQKNLPDHVKINLLSPSIDLLMRHVSLHRSGDTDATRRR
jgi:histidinol-phosphate/aromatic aminotransferase/cobyric acid decarboxylase-like protein